MNKILENKLEGKEKVDDKIFEGFQIMEEEKEDPTFARKVIEECLILLKDSKLIAEESNLMSYSGDSVFGLLENVKMEINSKLGKKYKHKFNQIIEKNPTEKGVVRFIKEHVRDCEVNQSVRQIHASVKSNLQNANVENEIKQFEKTIRFDVFSQKFGKAFAGYDSRKYLMMSKEDEEQEMRNKMVIQPNKPTTKKTKKKDYFGDMLKSINETKKEDLHVSLINNKDEDFMINEFSENRKHDNLQKEDNFCLDDFLFDCDFKPDVTLSGISNKNPGKYTLDTKNEDYDKLENDESTNIKIENNHSYYNTEQQFIRKYGDKTKAYSQNNYKFTKRNNFNKEKLQRTKNNCKNEMEDIKKTNDNYHPWNDLNKITGNELKKAFPISTTPIFEQKEPEMAKKDMQIEFLQGNKSLMAKETKFTQNTRSTIFPDVEENKGLTFLDEDNFIVKEEILQILKNLLGILGIKFVTAAEEAEAQCAYLEMRNIVSYTLTEDSDTLLFGSQRIIRNFGKFYKGEGLLEVYDMREIEQKLGINREKLIMSALLLGCDYSEGVRGVGVVNTAEILNCFETVEQLRELFHVWGDLPDAVNRSLDFVKEKMSQKQRDYFEAHRNYKKHWIIPDGFPDAQVIEAFKSPKLNTEFNEKDLMSVGQFQVKEFGDFVERILQMEMEDIEKMAIGWIDVLQKNEKL